MNVALRKRMSQEEFFAWAERQDGRYEFDGHQPVAMTGGTLTHGLLAENIRGELRQRLRAGCRVFSSDGGAVETINGRLRYPEATVTCSPLRGADRKIPAPIIIFEVLSDSTRRVDQVFKLREYHAVPSVKRYLIVEQTGVAVTVHSRKAEEPWTTVVRGANDVLELPEIGLEIAVNAIYDGVALDGAEPSSPD